VYHSGSVWKEFPPGADRFALQFSEKTIVDGSGWFALVVEADDVSSSSLEHASQGPDVFSQAITNCVRVYAGGKQIRNPDSATYFLNWIDKLRDMTRDLSLWRTVEEREHVFEQFAKASAVYDARKSEAIR